MTGLLRSLPALAFLALLGCPKPEAPRPSKIAFTIERAGTSRALMVMDAAGGEPEPIAWVDSYDETPCWSPDGFTLLFSSSRESHFGI